MVSSEDPALFRQGLLKILGSTFPFAIDGELNPCCNNSAMFWPNGGLALPLKLLLPKQVNLEADVGMSIVSLQGSLALPLFIPAKGFDAPEAGWKPSMPPSFPINSPRRKQSPDRAELLEEAIEGKEADWKCGNCSA